MFLNKAPAQASFPSSEKGVREKSDISCLAQTLWFLSESL